MRILGHIHTFNDDDVIDRSLAALLSQTRGLDGLLIVDNASSDSTLARQFPDLVTVIRNPCNLGTSGAVRIGMRYALDHGFDWVWIMDADGAPHPDALEKLVAFWEKLPQDVKRQTWRLSSLPMDLPAMSVTARASVSLAFFRGNSAPKPRHGMIFTDKGYRWVEPEAGAEPYQCDGTIWAGSMFRLDAVRKVGLPEANYVLDWGEYQYGYRGRCMGFRGYMHPQSLLDLNIGGHDSVQFTPYRIGPVGFRLVELAPIRCYYLIRNVLYFWIYEYSPRSITAILIRLYKSMLLTLNFLVRPFSRWSEIVACLRGFRDGFSKNMDRRY